MKGKNKRQNGSGSSLSGGLLASVICFYLMILGRVYTIYYLSELASIAPKVAKELTIMMGIHILLIFFIFYCLIRVHMRKKDAPLLCIWCVVSNVIGNVILEYYMFSNLDISNNLFVISVGVLVACPFFNKDRNKRIFKL